MNTTIKVINTATASNGKKFQRTTKAANYKFACTFVFTDGSGLAHFFATQQEAVAKISALQSGFGGDYLTALSEVVTVAHSPKA
jgi:purine nucleoside permease